MQSEILTFEKKGEKNKLFGDFNSLCPKYTSGVAHSFLEGNNWILTFYNETGLINQNEKICSADFRISIDKQNLKTLIDDLKMLIDYDRISEEKKTPYTSSNPKQIKETLGIPLK